MSDIIQIIKKAAVSAVSAENPTQVFYGNIESLEPLKIRINPQIVIAEKFITMISTIKALKSNNQLEIGAKVLLIREQGGQNYLLVDIIPNEDWEPEYPTGEDGRGIESIISQYCVSDSDEIAPEKNWSDNAPHWEKGKFLWLRNKIIYNNPTEVFYSTAICDSSWTALNEFIPKFEETQVNVEKTIDGLRQEVSTNYLAYGEFEAYKSTAIEQTDEKIAFQFNTVNAKADEIADDLEKETIERKKYINFIDGEIILGEENNRFQTIIDNEAMKFTENGQVVAHISNKTLNVDDTKVDGHLDLAGFRFYQRANGNMSIIKI